MTESLDATPNTEPALLLADGIGGYYAIPRSLAESCRASEALVAAAQAFVAEREAATDEVTGYDLSPRALLSCTVGGVVLLVAAAGLAGGTHGLATGNGSQQASSVGYHLGGASATGGSQNAATSTGGGQNGTTATGGGGNGAAPTGGGHTGYTATGGGTQGTTSTGGGANASRSSG